MNNIYKILITSITVLILCSFCGVASFAAENQGQTKTVKSEEEFAQAVCTAEDGDSIVLNDDISIHKTIEIKKSLTVDLNGHKITVICDDNGIICGARVFDHIEHYTVKIPGYFKKAPEKAPEKSYVSAHTITLPNGRKQYGLLSLVRQRLKKRLPTFNQRIPLKSFTITQNVSGKTMTTYKTIWVADREETRSRYIYKFLDINVVLKNGKIVQAPAKNGEHGKEDTFFNYNGKDGKSKKAPIKAFSGNLTLLNIKIQGADGGNGGNGEYQSLWHVPFGGGDGGKGGKGGNGTPAIEINAKHAKVFADENDSLIGGQGGKGGKAGKPNPNYWLYSGFSKMDGIVGQSGSSFEIL